MSAGRSALVTAASDGGAMPGLCCQSHSLACWLRRQSPTAIGIRSLVQLAPTFVGLSRRHVRPALLRKRHIGLLGFGDERRMAYRGTSLLLAARWSSAEGHTQSRAGEFSRRRVMTPGRSIATERWSPSRRRHQSAHLIAPDLTKPAEGRPRRDHEADPVRWRH
jgi:hypothetical protein